MLPKSKLAGIKMEAQTEAQKERHESAHTRSFL
jgi:hypothetical protein